MSIFLEDNENARSNLTLDFEGFLFFLNRASWKVVLHPSTQPSQKKISFFFYGCVTPSGVTYWVALFIVHAWWQIMVFHCIIQHISQKKKLNK